MPAKGDDDGAPPHSGADRPRSERSGSKPARPTQIELEVSRQRSIGWTIFGLIVGVLLIHGLGTVGVWAGIALVGAGLYHAWQVVQTVLHPPGTIVVAEHEVVLPRGLCMPRPVVVAPRDVTAIYFLRRSVPWNRAAPVLIIELGERAMVFPRDWFASEADQRHVIHAVLRAKGEAAPASAGDPDAA
ncbi:MAG TPA: hypothetical protein VHW23_01500 [Kofleriaceae bacterium]|nr:hypothetical protein [Kofleriaceae bacterium]